jgi:hypothetical protein
MPPPVKVLAHTAINAFALRSFQSFCLDHSLDPKMPLAFSRFCNHHGYDSSALISLSIVTDSGNDVTIATRFGLSSFQAGDETVVTGTLASWGLFFQRQQNNAFANAVKRILDTQGIYDY